MTKWKLKLGRVSKSLRSAEGDKEKANDKHNEAKGALDDEMKAYAIEKKKQVQ